MKKMNAIEIISNASNRANSIENLRSMLLTMINDVHVVLIKLATQCYIMRNLYNLDLLEQQKIAYKTLNVYALLANRLIIY